MAKKRTASKKTKKEKALGQPKESLPRKSEPTSGVEASKALVMSIFGPDTEAGASLAHNLHHLADDWPKEFKAAMKVLAKVGRQLGQVLEEGSPFAKRVTRPVLAYRQRIIAELEITSTAEFMLLDAAIESYAHWLELSALVWESFKDGWTNKGLPHQARLVGITQSYLRTFTDCMKALMDVKYPQIRVLRVQAGQNVAVQVNEQPRKALEEKNACLDKSNGERKNLPQSAPADATSARPNTG